MLAVILQKTLSLQTHQDTKHPIYTLAYVTDVPVNHWWQQRKKQTLYKN